jgi:hypothetical protein
VSKDKQIELLTRLVELQNHILRNHPPAGYNAALMTILMISGRMDELQKNLEEYIKVMPAPEEGEHHDKDRS